MDIHICQDVLSGISGFWSLLMTELARGKAVYNFSSGLVYALFAGYACLKWFELLGETEGQSISQRVFLAYKQFRKQFVIYVLVVAAPWLAEGMAGIARSQVQRAFTIVNALDGLAAQTDGALNSINDSFDSIRLSVAAACGWTTSEYNAANRSLAIHQLKASPEAKEARKCLIEATDKMTAQLRQVGDAPAGSPAASKKKLLTQAIQRNQDLLRAGDDALKNISQEEKDNWKAYMAATNEAANESMLQMLGRVSRAGAVGGVAGAGAEIYGREIKDAIKEVLITIAVTGLAIFVYCIAMVAVGTFGLTVVKQAYQMLAYIVGIWAAVSVGAAIALPVCGLFMFCLISEKTEVYGRNFISFWFSMVFGCIGLATMAELVGQAIRSLMPLAIAPGLQGIIAFSGANSFKTLAMGLVQIFLVFFAAGAALSYFCSLLRKGLNLGTGFWSGTFTA